MDKSLFTLNLGAFGLAFFSHKSYFGLNVKYKNFTNKAKVVW
jgi:hypothetical protein